MFPLHIDEIGLLCLHYISQLIAHFKPIIFRSLLLRPLRISHVGKLCSILCIVCKSYKTLFNYVQLCSIVNVNACVHCSYCVHTSPSTHRWLTPTHICQTFFKCSHVVAKFSLLIGQPRIAPYLFVSYLWSCSVYFSYKTMSPYW